MLRLLAIIGLLFIITACKGGVTVDDSESVYHPETPEQHRSDDMDSLLTKNKDPIVIYSSKKSASGSSGNAAGNGVAGSYLWRATLESIAFMPLSSVDSNGGVIITDWYSSPNSPNERLKFNIIILSPELQISSIKVTAFRQVQHFGQWQSAEVTKELSRTIEDNILRKAIALNATNTPK